MNGIGPLPMAQKEVVCVYFTCVLCGTVEEVPVPREEGLPAKIYWECPGCQMRAEGDRRRKIA